MNIAPRTKQVRFTDLDAFARSLEPRARRAFLQAIDDMKGSSSLANLQRAVATGSIFAVQEALRVQDLAEHLSGLRDVILDAVRGGGEIAAAEVGVGIRFDITDERALRYIQGHAGQLIREIDDATRAGIVDLVDYEFRQGRAPLPTARRIRERVGLTAYQERIAQNYETLLRATVRDMAAGTVHGAIANAAAERGVSVERYLMDRLNESYALNPIRGPGGLLESRVDTAVAQYRQRLLAMRAETIARTETLTAAHEGQAEAWRQLERRGALPPGVRREWMVAPGCCDLCSELDGETATLDGTYPGGYDRPPLHPNCRCDEVLVGL